ncbi:DUF1326 domain-containing protein [Chelativorans salis]|uniref:DUF1326 domain-containing protein n=1 Tax=Chelativorans salis TaxID=2978478 RepID=A0ABT2LL63_9HYPH|nr:DUF1326 domain-containing protein [Chelativorans sp. EGI FJ00035]MCT7373924.1 DUF1326 domain-containing protein [Chelativorans sp. EGI FJ00035]
MIDWNIEASTFGNCNCDYCCPCQFELRPTHGDCKGVEVGRIERGHFGDVTLDGLHWALLFAWPGAIFEGNGTMQAIVDERADDKQREALLTVLHGGETEEARTHWWVFHAMSSTVHEPIFKPIQFEVDYEKRTARAAIPGILETSGRPIVSPATGEEHRVRIDIPGGIEFEIAEIGSASTTASGPIVLDLKDSYGQFNMLHHTGKGVVRSRS